MQLELNENGLMGDDKKPYFIMQKELVESIWHSGDDEISLDVNVEDLGECSFGLDMIEEIISHDVELDGQPMRASFEIMKSVFSGFFDGIEYACKDQKLSPDEMERFALDCIKYGTSELKKWLKAENKKFLKELEEE